MMMQFVMHPSKKFEKVVTFTYASLLWPLVVTF